MTDRHVLVLHPQLKLKYFQQNGWVKKWVDTAEAIIRAEFVKYGTAPETPPVVCCYSKCPVVVLTFS